MAEGRRFGVLAVAFGLAGCAASTAQPLSPNDPKFAAAIDATAQYAAKYYHLTPKMCGTTYGFRFGVQQDGERLFVDMIPPRPHNNAITVSLRKSDLKLIEARHLPPRIS